MRRLIEEVEGEGLDGLMGEVVTLMCANYFYTGKLVGVNKDFVKLENPGIVYDTGGFDTKGWADMQRLPHKYFYVMVPAIESFGIMK